MSKRPFFTAVFTALFLAACQQSPQANIPLTSSKGLKGDDPAVSQMRGQPQRFPKSQQVQGVLHSSLSYLPKGDAPFGPRTYTRSTGTPVQDTSTFSATPGPSSIRMKSDGVTTAEIILNDQVIAGPSDFNGGNLEFVRQAMLQESNTLIVKLAGKPGTKLTISTPAPTMQALTGVLKDSKGSPIAGTVTITFPATGQSAQITATTDGSFSLPTLPGTGKFILNAVSSTGEATSVSGSYSSSIGQVRANLITAPRGTARVTGTVFNVNGQPLAGALVTLNFAESSFTQTVITDAQGQYLLDQLPSDGSFAVTGFDQATLASATRFSYLAFGGQQQTVDLNLKSQADVPTGFNNGNFSQGNLNSWTVDGSAQVTPKNVFFPELGAQGVRLKAQSSSSYAAVISSADDSRAQGTLSKTFKPGSCDTNLRGKVRFVSNEYPTWYGTKYNDSYMVTLTTPYGVQTISSGNLNSSSWQGGVGGYSGATPVIPIDIDLTQFEQDGTEALPLTLTMSVSDVGDLVVDSGVAAADFELTSDPNKVQLRNVEALSMKAPDVATWILPNDDVPASTATPFTMETEKGLIVVARESDVQGGKLDFKMPVEVQGFDPQKHCNAEAYFKDVESEPTRITGSKIEIPVRYPVGSKVQLANVAVQSAGTITAASASTASGLQAQALPGPQYVQLVAMSGGGAPDLTSIPKQYWTAFTKWMAGDTDWETIKFFLKMGWDMVPVLGDGTEIAVQVANYAIGKGADPIAVGLSAIGLGLDLVPTPATEAGGALVSSTRTIYKLSKAGKGLLADAIGETVKKFTSRQLTASQAVDVLKTYMETYTDLLKLGIKNVEYAETVGVEVRKFMVDTNSPVTAVKLMANGIKNLQNYVPNVSKALQEIAEVAHLPGAFGTNSPFRRVLKPKAEKELIEGALGEIRHAGNVLSGGGKNVEFPGQITAGGVVADVDVKFIASNGKLVFDDAKQSLNSVSSSAKTQAGRLCEAAKASGALARWVVEGAFDLDAINTIEGRGVMVVNSSGQRLGNRPDLAERQVTCGK